MKYANIGGMVGHSTWEHVAIWGSKQIVQCECGWRGIRARLGAHLDLVALLTCPVGK